MANATPAESILRWFNEPGLNQAILRWAALIPGVICIALFSQLILLSAVSLFAPNGNVTIALWLRNTLNAAFISYLVIAYVTPITPSFRRIVGIALAVVAVVLVGLARLTFELSNSDQTPWRYAWLAVAVALYCISVWFGIRRVTRKERLREQCGKQALASPVEVS